MSDDVAVLLLAYIGSVVLAFAVPVFVLTGGTAADAVMDWIRARTPPPAQESDDER